MDFIVATILALILGVGVSITDKWILTRLAPKTVLIIIGAYGFLTLLLLPITNSSLPQGWILVAGLGIGALFAALIYCSFRAIEQEEISRLAPLGTLSTVLVIIGSIIFFNEPLTMRKGVAFLLFILGSFLLATRFERQLLIFEPGTYATAFKNAHHHARKTVHAPFRHVAYMTRTTSRHVQKLLANMHASKLLLVRSKTKTKLVKGFWWFMTAILFSVIVIIGMKWLTVRAGTIPGFVSMRLGMAIAIALGVAISGISLRAALGKHPRAALVATIKEPVGITIGFLLAYAYAHGELGIIRSIMSLESVILLFATIVLTRIGIMHESLSRKDIIQKAAGISCMFTGTILLFL